MDRMKKIIIFFIVLFCFSYFLIHPTDRAVLMNNTIKDIEACKGKLKLKLIRVWGEDEEEDVNKLFYTPSSVVVDDNQFVYICDWHNNCIKIFEPTGKYLRTIGRKGRGPGDIYAPKLIALSTVNDILVYEWGGRRFQWFSSQGKSKRILKYNSIVSWFGITSLNEIAVYDSYKTFTHKKLITIINNNGKALKEVGVYHGKSENYISSEKLKFSIDKNDCIHAANVGTPVIRKYSPDGRLLMVITFETPFEIPVEITLNPAGDEIERKEKVEIKDDIKIVETSRGVSIQKKNKNTYKKGICIGIGIDDCYRIFIVSRRRKLTNKEEEGTTISGTVSWINREKVNYDMVEKNDFNHMLVFDSNGKIIAESTMTTLCDDIYISGNRIFIIDGLINQRVMEYEITFYQ